MTEILYLAYNRLEFTRMSLATMIANTDWSNVSRVVLYDDGSTDGTLEYLKRAILPVPTELRQTAHVGPVGVMVDFLLRGGQPIFAKIDNDVMLPPGWLGECLALMDDVDMLGIEAMTSGELPRRAESALNIGGIGLMRRSVFTCLPVPKGRFGFTEWQHRHQDVRKAWITPPLPVCLLNLVPFEPWASLSREYIARGWQREWPGPYPEKLKHLWSWWA